MPALGRLLATITSFILVCLTIEPGLGMTLSEDQRDMNTMMAPADDLLESTSQMTVTQKYTESSEVQEHINRLFTDAGRPIPTNWSTGRSLPGPGVPQCAAERAYCTEGEAEVTEDISRTVDQLLGSNPGYSRQYNATDVLTQEDKTIIQRGTDDPDENHLCGFKVELSRVTWATSEDKVVMRIAQSRDFAQAVRLEHCTDHNCGCHAMFTSGLPGRYVARCKQKYVYRQLLALTEDAKKTLKLVPHSFPLPSCCSCVITKQLNVNDEGDKCKKEGRGLGGRSSQDDDDPPPGDDNMDRSKKTSSASIRSHRTHLLLCITSTTIYTSLLLL